MRCKGCQYSLENLTEPRCPECGRAFDPSDPRTFSLPRPPVDPAEIPTTHVIAMLVGSFGVPFVLIPQGSWSLLDVLQSGVLTMILGPFIFALVFIAYVAIIIPCMVTIRWIRSRGNES